MLSGVRAFPPFSSKSREKDGGTQLQSCCHLEQNADPLRLAALAQGDSFVFQLRSEWALQNTNADPSTHHPQAEKRLGPRSLRMTTIVMTTVAMTTVAMTTVAMATVAMATVVMTTIVMTTLVLLRTLETGH
jgi:hypothetical protein